MSLRRRLRHPDRLRRRRQSEKHPLLRRRRGSLAKAKVIAKEIAKEAVEVAKEVIKRKEKWMRVGC